MKKVVVKKAPKKVKKIKAKKIVELVEPIEPVVDPRADYNCNACKGSGLLGDQFGLHKVCETCKGTGKV